MPEKPQLSIDFFSPFISKGCSGQIRDDVYCIITHHNSMTIPAQSTIKPTCQPATHQDVQLGGGAGGAAWLAGSFSAWDGGEKTNEIRSIKFMFIFKMLTQHDTPKVYSHSKTATPKTHIAYIFFYTYENNGWRGFKVCHKKCAHSTSLSGRMEGEMMSQCIDVQQ